MRYRIAAHTDVGRVRELNQDAYLTDDPLIALADGMGGHRAGDVAAALALEVLAGYKDRFASEGPASMPDAFREANRAIHTRGVEDANLEGMGTTLTAAWIAGDTVHLAHVGDSRAYLLRGGMLSRLTEDDTLVARLEREGQIEPGEAHRHPQRNVLIQAIGSEDDVTVARSEIQLMPGDRLLLTSDGLHDYIEGDDVIKDILLAQADVDEACQALVQAGLDAGGDDNITVVLLEVAGDRAVSDTTPPAGIPVATAPSKTRRRPAIPRPSMTTILAGVAGLLVAFLFVLFVIVRSQTANQLLIGASDGNVAILRGAPGHAGQPPEAEVVRVFTDIPLDAIADPYQSDLRSGIVVSSLEEAERRIAALPRVLGPQDTPLPSPSVPTPSPVPTGDPTIPPLSPAP